MQLGLTNPVFILLQFCDLLLTNLFSAIINNAQFMDVKLLLCKLLMTQRISKKTKHKKTAFKLLSLYSITLFADMNAIPLKTSFFNRFAKASFHLRKAYPVLQSLVNRN